MPATSFSEYHPTETITGASGKPIKAATWFRLKGEEDRPPFAFAGLMRCWNWEKHGLRRKSDEPLRDANTQVIAMTFLTTDANAVVALIHPKAMPVILRTQKEFDLWLTGSAEDAMALQKPLPDDALEIVFIGGGRTRNLRSTSASLTPVSRQSTNPLEHQDEQAMRAMRVSGFTLDPLPP